MRSVGDKIIRVVILLCIALQFLYSKDALGGGFEHLTAGMLIGITTSKLVKKVSPEDKWAQFFIPTIISGIAGWGVEWAQFQSNRGISTDVTEDILTTTLGGAIGATIEIEF